MKIYYLIVPFLLFACTNVAHNTQVQSVSKENNKMTVRIMPITKEKKKANELLFHARFFLKKELLEQNKNFAQALQYQVDSSFYLIDAKDTLWPYYVLPVVNGQPLMPEYIVSFESKHLKDHSAIEFRSNLMNGLLFDSSLHFSLNIN